MATNSIVPPVEHGDKAPIKKTTLLGVLGVLVIVFIVGAMLGTSNTPPQTPGTARKDDQAEPRKGTARDVDEELAAADDARRKERSRVDNSQAPPAPLPRPDVSSPIPKSLAREGNGAAAENGFDPEEERRKAIAERDARASVATLVVFDSKSSAPGANAKGVADSPDALIEAIRQAGTQKPGGGAQNIEDAIKEQLLLREKILNVGSKPEAGTPASKASSWLQAGQSPKLPQTLYPVNATGKYILTQGKSIPSVLLRSMNTDLPCEVSARTLVDVYDSLRGDALLIPRGSELVGKCSADIQVGQTRILFAFQRIILPNGKSFALPNAMGMDKTGSSGIEGDVNNHFFKMFTSSFIVAFLAERAERNQPATGPLGGTGGARSAAGEVLVDVSRTILDRNKTIPPTITVDAGTRINVNVAADMDFLEPYKY